MSDTATYCPEDNKLRLYVGRVPRDEYLQLREEGWTSTPKQSCDFVAAWTPERRDTCLEYAGIIEDEDQSPEERSADRAERFGGYRDKREAEAVGHAERFDASPSVHGYQSAERGARAARRHDRIAARAVDSWSKAEYWTSRTAGVISHALHKSTPGVRMGRIKELEAAIRKHEKETERLKFIFKTWLEISIIEDEIEKTKKALAFCGGVHMWCEYKHPRAESLPEKTWAKDHATSLHSLMSCEADPISGREACDLFLGCHSEPADDDEWSTHYRLRLAYENQMLEAQGGRAAFVEMVPGGWIGSHQIRKVNKSPASGRVVSVTLKIPGDRWGNSKEGFHMMAFNIERLSVSAYRPPTAEDLESLNDTKKKEKAAAPEKADCPLINPTMVDAQRLQAAWNDAIKTKWDAKRARDKAAGHYDYTPEFVAAEVCCLTQARYSDVSKGTYARAQTADLVGGGQEFHDFYGSSRGHERKLAQGPKLCKVRKTGGKMYMADRVIVITDKPQKPFPAALWELPAVVETAEAEPDKALRGRDSHGLSYSVNG